jgi:hypothetical protein
MEKLNLMIGFNVLAALSLFASGCGGSRAVVVGSNPIIVSSSGGLPTCSSGGSVGSSGGSCGSVPVSSGGYPISSGGSSGGVPVSSGGSSGGIIVSSGGSSGGIQPVGPAPVVGSSGGVIVVQPIGPAYPVNGPEDSVEGNSKDVDLERADAQSAAIEDRAQTLAASYSMDIDAARQLTQLADKMTELTNQNGGMTDQDRAAVTDAALQVAGISGDEVNAAYAQAIQTKDTSAVNALLSKGATNLGMSSTAALRDQILPSLGVNLGTLGQ